jgi:ribonucleoside-triphosphate reductase
MSKNREDFLENVQEYTELASKINHVKRYIIRKRIESGHYPLYTLGFMDIKRQYSTCGLVGINEACEILKTDIMTKEGQQLVIDALDIINKVNSIQEKKYKYPHNVEQVPAESAAIKLAEADKLLGYNTKYKLYSNQFIPLISEADFYDRIKLQGMFDKHLSGGAIAHLNIVDRIKDVNYMAKIIEHAVTQGVVYFAINYNLQDCAKGHITVGKNDKCPQCGSPITGNYERVVGFLVKVNNWHPVRRTEDYPNRVRYDSSVLEQLPGEVLV